MVRAAWDGRSDLRQLNKTRRLRNRLMGIATLNAILRVSDRRAFVGYGGPRRLL
jgi:hypothetical protein